MKYVFAAAIAVLIFLSATEALGAQAIAGRIAVTATLTRNHYRDVGQPGRQSDVVEQSWRVNDRYGHPIGRMLWVCRWVLRKARYCQAELEMPRGYITATGSSPTAFEGVLAVTGGTGIYEGGGGTLTFTAIGIRKSVLLIFITN